jgi:hypothetical protein
MGLTVKMSIGALQTEVDTDQDLSFDAIESVLNRAVQSTLQAYMSLPTDERMRVIYDVFSNEDDEEDD